MNIKLKIRRAGDNLILPLNRLKVGDGFCLQTAPSNEAALASEVRAAVHRWKRTVAGSGRLKFSVFRCNDDGVWCRRLPDIAADLPRRGRTLKPRLQRLPARPQRLHGGEPAGTLDADDDLPERSAV